MLTNAKLLSIICSSRLDSSVRFYTDKLGLAAYGESEGARVFDVNGSELRVSPVPSVKPSEHTVLGFSVSNLDKVVTELSARGIEMERFAGFSHAANGVLQTPFGSRVAWFRDPDGNLLSVVQFPD